MSLFGKIFGGGGKGGKGPSPQEAIQKLRETEEMLTKKQEFLEKKIEQELQIAKKNGMKNKRGETLGGLFSSSCLLSLVKSPGGQQAKC